MEYLFKDYRITQVYQNIGVELRQEIIRLWIDSAVLDHAEASRRVDEVFFVVRNVAGRLTGVSTVYLGDFLRQGRSYWFLRLFIRPGARGVFDLASCVSRKTKEALRHQEASGARPLGVVIVTENPKLWRKGAHRVLARDGWMYLGKGPKGNDVWYERFDGTRITRS